MLTLRSVSARPIIALCALFLTASAALCDEADEFRERAKAMMQKARALSDMGRVNEAEDMERGAHKLLEAAKNLDRDADAPQAKSEKKREKIRNVEATIAQKKKETAEKSREGQEKKRPESSEFDQLPQRLKHARIAVDNLHAAGMSDLAKETAHRAQQMEQAWKEAQTQREKAEQATREKGNDRLDDLRKEIHQLREELKEIRSRLPQK